MPGAGTAAASGAEGVPQAVALLPHDPAWAGLAATYGEQFAALLGDNLVVVHHIGSTAIPGIRAKPIIDLMPVVADLAAVDRARPALEAAGHAWRGEFGLPGRRYLPKDDPATGRRLMHVHLYERGSDEIVRHLAFRDYMRSHPREAADYEAEKLRCMALEPDDIARYSEAKGAWIEAAERRALAWWRGRGGSL